MWRGISALLDYLANPREIAEDIEAELEPAPVGYDDPLEVSTLAGQIVAVAIGELGRGESGGNNRGPDIARYRQGRGKPGGSWCAWFVSWCICQAALRLGIAAPVKPCGGARKLYKRCVAAGREVDLEPVDPMQPGDIVAWRRGRLAWQGHIGIVVEAGVESYRTVEGNTGHTPAVVRYHRHRYDDPRLIGVARLG